MKTFNTITLLTLATLSVACNEKISPKLLDANQSTTVPPVIEPEVYHFRVQNTSIETRKFHLHKTGAGNYNKPCEIRETEKFSSDLYRGSERDRFDISCFFEAEELSLAQGFSFKFDASPNTCEYVGYSPFSFYNYQPGDSSGSYVMIECEEGVTTADLNNPANAWVGNQRPLAALGTRPGCNQMVLMDGPLGPTGISTNYYPTQADLDAESMCRFDYTQNGGPNCDIGKIRVRKLIFSAEVDENGNKTFNEPKWAEKPEAINCAGKITACISGPILEHEDREDEAAVITIYETEKNKPFEESREYGKIPRGFDTFFYANYRRNLANPNIDFETDDVSADNYVEAFREEKEFIPRLMENYAAGANFAGTKKIADLEDPITFAKRLDWDVSDYVTIGGNTIKTKSFQSYAAEPFMGKEKEQRTSPFYTFYCLDSAKEIRARIKMVVRDWDRFFSPDKTQFELLSDIFLEDQARMDNPLAIEIPGDTDSINGINDYLDWDDIIPMARDSGVLDPTNTVWSPIDGFNVGKYFPQVPINENKE